MLVQLGAVEIEASSLMGLFAAIYYLYPKIFGRTMNEVLGKVHFALTFITVNCTFFPIVILNTALQPRRYAYGTDGFEWLRPLQGLNHFRSISAFLLGAAQIIFLGNFFYSLFWATPTRTKGNPTTSAENLPRSIAKQDEEI